jgi:rod shape-determining protein MreD
VTLVLRIAAIVFGTAVIQVSAIAGGTILGAAPDLLLVTVIAIALVRGSITGAAAGFGAGLLVDVMTLGTLGLNALLLTLAGFWAGRYGETTGRGRPYAAPLAAFTLTIGVTLAGAALHSLLGEAVALGAVLRPLLPTALLAVVLVLPVHRLVRAILGEVPRNERVRDVDLLRSPGESGVQ